MRVITIGLRTTVCEIFQKGLEEFTDNLEDTEVPAFANTSYDSDSELLVKVATRKADHKVVNEGGESRNSRQYAVVVQDLATQWI